MKKNRHHRRAAKAREKRGAAGPARAPARSTPAEPMLSPSPALPADKLALLEAVDGYAHLRGALREIADRREHWAGIPMPVEGAPLRIEPTFPNAAALAGIGAKEPGETLPADFRLRNRWWSRRLNAEIGIWEEGGKLCWAALPAHNRLTREITTLQCSVAWGIEQEGIGTELTRAEPLARKSGGKPRK